VEEAETICPQKKCSNRQNAMIGILTHKGRASRFVTEQSVFRQ
jgi:hypothetical protein